MGCVMRRQYLDSPWTDERVAALRQMWADGNSAGMIARRLGLPSRNAVIGKVYRLGLPCRKTHSRKDKPQRQTAFLKRPIKARRPTARSPLTGLPLERPPIPPSEPYVPTTAADDVARIFDVQQLQDTHCRWPVGEPEQPGFGFCGCTKVPGLPYCRDHAARAYVPVQVPERPYVRRVPKRSFEPA